MCLNPMICMLSLPHDWDLGIEAGILAMRLKMEMEMLGLGFKFGILSLT